MQKIRYRSVIAYRNAAFDIFKAQHSQQTVNKPCVTSSVYNKSLNYAAFHAENTSKLLTQRSLKLYCPGTIQCLNFQLISFTSLTEIISSAYFEQASVCCISLVIIQRPSCVITLRCKYHSNTFGFSCY